MYERDYKRTRSVRGALFVDNNTGFVKLVFAQELHGLWANKAGLVDEGVDVTWVCLLEGPYAHSSEFMGHSFDWVTAGIAFTIDE